MKTNIISLKDQRKRKILLAMPPIVFCFTTILFMAFGGGQGEQAKAAPNKGLSMKLPSAIIAEDQTGDKMSFYDQARADSLKKQQLRRADPFAQNQSDSLNRLTGAYTGGAFSAHQPGFDINEYGSRNNSPAENEARISQRLSQLQALINKPQPSPLDQPVKKPMNALPDSILKPSVGAEDPELKQMNGLLEKILDIQHPERVKASAERSGAAAPVKKFRAIPAVVDGTQKIVQGTVVRLKLTDTVTLGGQLYAKGQRIYGSGNLSNQRYTLNIKSIHVGYNFYPVDLTVFDQTDGLEGISVPEAVTGDVLRDGAISGLQNMDIMSFDPSMTAQLTTAGINTAKGLFSKKVKRVKAKIRDGHLLLLRDNLEVKTVH
ncbi:conjugative transposon TraM protein [Mucilaginibacter oryzae]|uniref:Conjugative transposon TraM protein n=1 Tax=Mucilaginibacter oryzae TaxID=468058 RepID=A0A316HI95_9SPHI|nr:conjugative transposon protein TraM [Mucilaginibacter oryzae]PWK72935.1 conjugative transposon TraM protein [Mucilaginibacter oryzae]